MENNQIALPETFKPEVFKSLLDKAPGIYLNSQSRVEKAIAVGKALIELSKKNTAESGRITDEIDIRLNKYLVNCRAAIKEINDDRKPITDIFTTVSKMYVALENSIDTKNSESKSSEIQVIRNNYAAQKAREAEIERQKAVRDLAIKTEKANYLTDYKAKLRVEYYTFLALKSNELCNIFEGAKLETIATTELSINKFSIAYHLEHFQNINPNIRLIYLAPDEAIELSNQACEGLYEEFSKDFEKVISEHKDSYLEKLPSKRNELQRIADAAKVSAEASAKLQLESEQRKQADLLKTQEENEKKQNEIALQSTSEKLTIQANLAFDSEASASGLYSSSAPVRTGYNIIVKHQLGYQLIAAKYFEKQASNETIVSLEKKTLGQMKTYCEKLAKETGEKIDNKWLDYIEVFTAVNKK